MLLALTQTQERTRIKIIINASDIRIRMMDDIVFSLPHKVIRTKKIDRKRCNIVQPVISTETSMCAIMHYIETNSRGKCSQRQTLGNSQPWTRCKKHKVY